MFHFFNFTYYCNREHLTSERKIHSSTLKKSCNLTDSFSKSLLKFKCVSIKQNIPKRRILFHIPQLISLFRMELYAHYQRNLFSKSIDKFSCCPLHHHRWLPDSSHWLPRRPSSCPTLPGLSFPNRYLPRPILVLPEPFLFLSRPDLLQL